MDKKDKIAIAILFVFTVTGAFFLALDIAKNIGAGPENTLSGKAQINDISDWKYFRDTEAGFEIGYPAGYFGKENQPDNGSEFDCGKLIGKSFSILTPGEPAKEAYRVSAYENPLRLNQKGFFECKEKLTSDNNGNNDPIRSVNAFKIGGDGADAVSIVLTDGSESVLLDHDKKIIEIKRNPESDSDEFRKILDTFRYLPPDPQVLEIESFCAQKLKVDADKLIAYPIDIKEDKGNGDEKFLLCDASNDETVNALALHLDKDAKGGYEVIWQKEFYTQDQANLKPDAANWNYLDGAKAAGDINNDGFVEILFSGGKSGLVNEKCIEGCFDTCLYVPAKTDFICINNCQGWEESQAVLEMTASLDCVYVNTDMSEVQGCPHSGYSTLCFSEEISDPELTALKDYLKKAANAESVD